MLRLPRNSKFKMSARNPWIASTNIKIFQSWSEHDPTMKLSFRTLRFRNLTRPILEMHFIWKNTNFRAPAIPQNCTKWCACHEKLHSNFHQRLRLTRKIYSTFFSLDIYFLLESILSWHLFSLGIYSLLASIFSWHLFSLGIYSFLAPILAWHLFSFGIYSLGIYFLNIYSFLIYILFWDLYSQYLFFFIYLFWIFWNIFNLEISQLNNL